MVTQLILLTTSTVDCIHGYVVDNTSTVDCIYGYAVYSTHFQLLEMMKEFKENEVLCDCILSVQDVRFPCHKVSLF